MNIKDINIDSLVSEKLKRMNLSKHNSRNKMDKRTSVFSVSQCSYSCLRKIYYDMTDPVQADDGKIGTFTVGDIIGNIIQEAFQEIGGIAEKEGGKNYYGSQIRIQGSSDVYFSDLVIEVKTVSPFAWKYKVGGRDKFGNVIIGQPNIQHVRQLNTYLDIFGVNDGLLLYVNKDTLKTCTFDVKKDDFVMIQTIGRCALVYNAIVKETLPNKTKSNECEWCGHSNVCKRN